MTDKELDLLLGLYTINRWHIVETSRPQNVMEHSFRVWLLATHLYDTLFKVSHNSFERDGVSQMALLHDSGELFTGDIPAPVKHAMNELAKDPEFSHKLDEHVLHRFLPTVAAWSRGQHRTLGGVVVALADMVEAILYIREYGHHQREIFEIEDQLCEAICTRLDRAERAYKSVDWKAAELWVSCRLGYTDLETGDPYLIRQKTRVPRSPLPASQPEQFPGSCSHPPHSPADPQASGMSSPDHRPLVPD